MENQRSPIVFRATLRSNPSSIFPSSPTYSSGIQSRCFSLPKIIKHIQPFAQHNTSITNLNLSNHKYDTNTIASREQDTKNTQPIYKTYETNHLLNRIKYLEEDTQNKYNHQAVAIQNLNLHLQQQLMRIKDQFYVNLKLKHNNSNKEQNNFKSKNKNKKIHLKEKQKRCSSTWRHILLKFKVKLLINSGKQETSFLLIVYLEVEYSIKMVIDQQWNLQLNADIQQKFQMAKLLVIMSFQNYFFFAIQKELVIILILLMFRKGDFQRVELLGSGKKHTKIYKAIHKQSGKVYAIKEIEAKSMDKLNQYKEQAVQLMKVQNHPNVIKFFGYYFSQTMYNAFRLNLVTEFMDNTMNMENIYRKRKKSGQPWKQKELVIMYCSIISTCAFLQNIGICHRDIKPANIFFLSNGQLKLIDFGQSKDYVYDLDDEEKNTFTMATIRGTPQYLSPILWKAHVVDGQSRYAQHNIYKSDVFSTGLVLFQMASMNQVSGFNSKTNQVNGEELIKQKLKGLQKYYSPSFVQLLQLILRFQQSQRPSFSQIQQLFINKQTSCKQSGKACNQYIKYYNTNFNNITKATNTSATVGLNSHLNSLREKQIKQQKMSQQSIQDIQKSRELERDKSKDKQKQKKKYKDALNYYKDSTLILNQNCYWFQFGGGGIGRFNISKLKWRIDNEEKTKKLPEHFVVIYIPDSKAYYLLGGQHDNNFRVFKNRRLQFNKSQIPGIRNFFTALHSNHKIFIFGGYNDDIKVQMNNCIVYDIHSDKWSEIDSMKTARSFASCCKINDNEILVLGGYNRQQGTLDTIQRYRIKQNRFDTLSVKLPIALRRFMVAKISKNIAIIFGGITKQSHQSQRVFKLDYEKQQFIELQSLEKGGAIENQILIDSEGHFHLFLEHANGTSPHAHIKYVYDPNHQKYATKMD